MKPGNTIYIRDKGDRNSFNAYRSYIFLGFSVRTRHDIRAYVYPTVIVAHPKSAQITIEELDNHDYKIALGEHDKLNPWS